MQDRDRLLRGVMWAVFIWGSILALGVGLFGVDARTGAVWFRPSLPRGLLVFACVAAYILFWRTMLAARARRD